MLSVTIPIAVGITVAIPVTVTVAITIAVTTGTTDLNPVHHDSQVRQTTTLLQVSNNPQTFFIKHVRANHVNTSIRILAQRETVS